MSREEQLGYRLQDMHVGLTETCTRTVSESDIVKFAEVSGDFNPMHLDEDYARRTRFRTRIAHGMLTASFVSAVLGMRLPGPGCIYLSQSLRFKAPVRIGDAVTATVSVRELSPGKKRVIFQTVASVGDTVVLEGEAEAYVPIHRPALSERHPA